MTAPDATVDEGRVDASPPLTADALGRVPWHALSATECLSRLHSRQDGLPPSGVEQRQAIFGSNSLPRAARPHAFKRLLRQFHNLLIYVLLASAALSLFLGHLVDAGVILAVVAINAAVGFIQEGRAEQALDAIRAMADPQAAVLRGGQRTTVRADQIVPGDVVLIEAGDRVPADLRLLRANSLRIEEAALTGESLAVSKQLAALSEAAGLADRTCMAFSGTFVVAGQGLGVATATGMQTQLGHISKLVSDVERLETPLTRQMAGFAQQLTLVILGIACVTFAIAWLLRGYPVADALMIVIGLAVAAIPEGLPAIMTITLAVGVQRMAARNAIIRRLPAVETLGSVSVICSDKTGTLTCNEMTVRRVVTGDGAYDVTGAGYHPAGHFVANGVEVDATLLPDVQLLARAALLCNDAALSQGKDGWRIDGDPLEGALLVLAAKAGCDAATLRRQLVRTAEIPFDAQHRFMASLHHAQHAEGLIVVKGAPERILSMCDRQRTNQGDQALQRAYWLEETDALARQGMRVLGFAMRTAGRDQQALAFKDVEHGLTFLGLAASIDPPRDEAIAAVADCHAAGIRVVMITGDHHLTAGEIARRLHIASNPTVLTGERLETLDDEALRALAQDTAVFARTTPEHKIRLVEALQAEGRVVAMTGDGVNDAPALKRADVGVAMGRKGTEAAKEAAEMVLADDNFASIVAAVREGRTVYANIMKVIAWTLPTNAGESLIIIVAVVLGLALPITPIQILWINMVTAVALGLTLAFEPTEPETMRRPPRPAGQLILTGDLLWRVLFVSALFVLAVFGMGAWAESRGRDIESARTLAVNTIVVMEIFYLFSVRYVAQTSLTWQGVLGTPAVLIGTAIVALAQLAFTYTPFMQAVFDTRPVPLDDALAILAVGVATLLIVELEKWVRRR
jgi:magnesium-transporting ATPase (P-type)